MVAGAKFINTHFTELDFPRRKGVVRFLVGV